MTACYLLLLGLAAGEPQAVSDPKGSATTSPEPPATGQAEAPATSAPAQEALRILVADLRPEGAEPGVAATLTTLVVQQLDAHAELEVLGGADLKEIANLAESRARLSDCDEGSCLAEISSALGARYVITGQVGALGALHIVSLSLFDSDEGKVMRRERVNLGALEAAPERLAPHVHNLMADTLGWEHRQPAPPLGDVVERSPTGTHEDGVLGAVSSVLYAGGGAVAALAAVSGGLAYVAAIAGTALLNGVGVEAAYSAIPLVGPLVHIGARPDLNLQVRVVYYIAFGCQAAAVFVLALGGAAAATGFLIGPDDAE